MASSEPNSDEFIQKFVVNPVGEWTTDNSKFLSDENREDFRKQEEAWREKYKEYEPYELSEIENIISEVKKKQKKTRASINS